MPVGQPQKYRCAKVCDSCIEAAAEHGAQDRETQALVMTELGEDLDDHPCDVVEAPDVVESCACRNC